MWQPIIGPIVSEFSENKHPHGTQLLVKSIRIDIHMATNCWITSVKQINKNKHPHGNELLDHLLVKLIIKNIQMAMNCWITC